MFLSFLFQRRKMIRWLSWVPTNRKSRKERYPEIIQLDIRAIITLKTYCSGKTYLEVDFLHDANTSIDMEVKYTCQK